MKWKDYSYREVDGASANLFRCNTPH